MLCDTTYGWLRAGNQMTDALGTYVVLQGFLYSYNLEEM